MLIKLKCFVSELLVQWNENVQFLFLYTYFKLYVFVNLNSNFVKYITCLFHTLFLGNQCTNLNFCSYQNLQFKSTFISWFRCLAKHKVLSLTSFNDLHFHLMNDLELLLVIHSPLTWTYNLSVHVLSSLFVIHQTNYNIPFISVAKQGLHITVIQTNGSVFCFCFYTKKQF